MLSRIAESLYWVGRYVERADDTARILDVHVHHILEDPTVDEEARCRMLLGVMGATAPDGGLDAARVVEILGYDRDNACSIVGALSAARLLLAGFGETSASDEWVTTLRSCSAHEAFLRTYRKGVDASLVAEFLLLDRLFPRSAFYALGVAERCLAELGPSTCRAGQEDEARRFLGRARN